MSDGEARSAGLRRALQRWTLATGFVVGQLGSISIRVTADPPAIVKLLPEQRAGFAPSEVVNRRMVLTLAEPHGEQRAGRFLPN